MAVRMGEGTDSRNTREEKQIQLAASDTAGIGEAGTEDDVQDATNADSL